MDKCSKSAGISFCPLNCFFMLVTVQVFCACSLAVVANVFGIQFLGDVALLLWIVLCVIFGVACKCHLVMRVLLSVGACALSLVICLLLHYVYLTIK